MTNESECDLSRWSVCVLSKQTHPGTTRDFSLFNDHSLLPTPTTGPVLNASQFSSVYSLSHVQLFVTP